MSSGHDTRFDFRRLRAQVPIDSLLVAYRLAAGLRRVGDRLIGPCPLHGGDNPTAFRVDLARGVWHCFTGCGGGDVVEMVRRIEHCSYAEAARHLARIAESGSALPHALLEPSPLAPTRPCPSHTAAALQPFRPFRSRIPLGHAAHFLQETKGISVATAAHFEAGLPDPACSFLRGTVAVRLHDLQGNPLGYCGRRLDPEDTVRWGKWRFPARFPKHHVLYNAHRALHYRPQGIVVVECPWAAMRLHQAGVHGAVALLGTSPSTSQLAWITRAPAVLLLLDGD